MVAFNGFIRSAVKFGVGNFQGGSQGENLQREHTKPNLSPEKAPTDPITSKSEPSASHAHAFVSCRGLPEPVLAVLSRACARNLDTFELNVAILSDAWSPVANGRPSTGRDRIPNTHKYHIPYI